MRAPNVIPLSAKIAAEISIQHALPMCTVLTPDLADKLRALNDMTRRLRAVGVRIEAASPLDGKISSTPRTPTSSPHRSAANGAARAGAPKASTPSTASASAAATSAG
ncbi:PIN domain-containing protein [Pseudomonas sihuiensis]|uniref:Uncharacterized protein n=1 Tax=Pseudomonas sihuiensis TaxID=1274359 RepID=A0A1H2L324_9PSED|nr:hypothetical protein [Pseudomonas sihuiensis]SDU75319.1 hypothetical protein SAMN05216363_0001 [Pseudomonas sihuiensis]